MKKSSKFSPEVRERAEDGAGAQARVPVSLGSGRIDRAEDRLRAANAARWVKRMEVDAEVRERVTTSQAQRVQDLERKVEERRRANEILKLASACFAQAALDRRLKS